MEFWGIEVKAGQPLKVKPGTDRILHLSQASLGEAKKGKGNESVSLFLKVDGQKLVIGTLSAEKSSHIAYDLVFEKEFELSHNWENGSVYFCGYKSSISEDSLFTGDDSSDYESGSEEDLPLVAEENGMPEQKNSPSKPSTDNAKSKVKVVVEQIKEEKVKEEDTEFDDDEDDSDDDAEDEDESDDEEMAASDDEDDSSDDEDEDESSDEEEDEATPKKAEQNKKRPAPAESDAKIPTGKKAKLVTPQKTDGEVKKTSGHTATPYPSKQAGKKTPANNDKSKQQTPASDGQVTCGSCSRSFKSNQALESHTKAKHGAAK